MNRSYPEGNWLLLCISTGQVTLAVLMNKAGPKKSAERRDKMSARNGKENRVLARLVKTFQNVGDVKKAPLACDRKQPES